MTQLSELRRRLRQDGMNALFEALSLLRGQIRQLLVHAFTKHRFGRLGRGSAVFRPLLLGNPRFVFIGENVTIRDGSRIETIRHYAGETFNPRLTIGDRTFVEFNLHIACAKEVTIGTDVLIAGDVYISDLHHGFGARGKHPLARPIRTSYVRIGDGCWLGERCIILPGVELGEGCVVGAAAVVTHSFPKGSIIAGVPARLIRTRDDL